MKRFGTAAILAGGRSERMGFDKQLIEFNKRRLVAIMQEKLSSCFDDVVVVTNRPALYESMPVRTVEDIIPGRGPLSGIHAALLISRSEYVFTIACDMPRFDEAYARYMTERIEESGAEACVTRYERWFEPFHAFYGRSLIPRIEASLIENSASVGHMLYNTRTLFIEEAEARAFSPDWSLFTNLNTRDKLNAYIAAAEGEL